MRTWDWWSTDKAWLLRHVLRDAANASPLRWQLKFECQFRFHYLTHLKISICMLCELQTSNYQVTFAGPCNARIVCNWLTSKCFVTASLKCITEQADAWARKDHSVGWHDCTIAVLNYALSGATLVASVSVNGRCSPLQFKTFIKLDSD